MRFFYNYIFTPLLAPRMGLVHSLETGSRRISGGLTNPGYLSGHFYASKADVLTVEVIDQQEIFPNLGDQAIQDNASTAIHAFMK
jgi:hypothetical protein